MDHARSDRILRPRQAAERLGVSLPTLYRWERDRALPQRIILGPGCSGWLDSELIAWLASRPRGAEGRDAIGHRSAGNGGAGR